MTANRRTYHEGGGRRASFFIFTLQHFAAHNHVRKSHDVRPSGIMWICLFLNARFQLHYRFFSRSHSFSPRTLSRLRARLFSDSRGVTSSRFNMRLFPEDISPQAMRPAISVRSRLPL